MLATQTLSCTEDYPLCSQVKSSKGHLEFLAWAAFPSFLPRARGRGGVGREGRTTFLRCLCRV